MVARFGGGGLEGIGDVVCGEGVVAGEVCASVVGRHWHCGGHSVLVLGGVGEVCCVVFDRCSLLREYVMECSSLFTDSQSRMELLVI